MTTAKEHFEQVNTEMARIGRHLFSNEDGKLLLETLVDMFYKGSLLGGDTHDTYFKLGQREVVNFLLTLRDKAKEK